MPRRRRIEDLPAVRRTAASDPHPRRRRDGAIPGEVVFALSADAAGALATSIPSSLARRARRRGDGQARPRRRRQGARAPGRAVHRPRARAESRGRDTRRRRRPPDDMGLDGTFRVRFGAGTAPKTVADRLSARTTSPGRSPTTPARRRSSPTTPNTPAAVGPAADQLPRGVGPYDGERGASRSRSSTPASTSTDPELASLIVAGQDLVDWRGGVGARARLRARGRLHGCRRGAPGRGRPRHARRRHDLLPEQHGAGVAGVNWSTRLMPVRVLARVRRTADNAISGMGTSANIAAGIRWAADHGARVINMSLGGPSDATVEREAVAYAVSKNVVVVGDGQRGQRRAPRRLAVLPGRLSRRDRSRRDRLDRRAGLVLPAGGAHRDERSRRRDRDAPTGTTRTPRSAARRWRRRTSPGSRRSCWSVNPALTARRSAASCAARPSRARRAGRPRSQPPVRQRARAGRCRGGRGGAASAPVAHGHLPPVDRSSPTCHPSLAIICQPSVIKVTCQVSQHIICQVTQPVTCVVSQATICPLTRGVTCVATGGGDLQPEPGRMPVDRVQLDRVRQHRRAPAPAPAPLARSGRTTTRTATTPTGPATSERGRGRRRRPAAARGPPAVLRAAGVAQAADSRRRLLADGSRRTTWTPRRCPWPRLVVKRVPPSRATRPHAPGCRAVRLPPAVVDAPPGAVLPAPVHLDQRRRCRRATPPPPGTAVARAPARLSAADLGAALGRALAGLHGAIGRRAARDRRVVRRARHPRHARGRRLLGGGEPAAMAVGAGARRRRRPRRIAAGHARAAAL